MIIGWEGEGGGRGDMFEIQVKDGDYTSGRKRVMWRVCNMITVDIDDMDRRQALMVLINGGDRHKETHFKSLKVTTTRRGDVWHCGVSLSLPGFTASFRHAFRREWPKSSRLPRSWVWLGVGEEGLEMTQIEPPPKVASSYLWAKQVISHYHIIPSCLQAGILGFGPRWEFFLLASNDSRAQHVQHSCMRVSFATR